uniref:Col_cuticle_N domain-containing protein n=1 Tax=Ascaris lumbricoides TaxID=6252 RepID=A0A0M3I2K0_ASCLU
MWSAMRWSATVSASVAGIALLSLLIAFPTVMNEIATMEEELALHRSEFIAMSNEMWDDLLTQSTIIRHAQNIRRRSISGIRSRRQYEGGTYSGSSQEGGSEYSEDKIAGDAEGNKCPAGPKGPPGEPGEKGEDGADGEPGKPGTDGVSISAKSGPCAPCPQGPPGFPGYKGRRGPRGQQGEKGAEGPPGRDGETGEEGPMGDIGPIGEIGPKGERGPRGKDGTKYARGPRGPKGETGPVGPEGDEGAPGERGIDAKPGPQGEIGPIGPPGSPGRKGQPGLPGRPGPAGGDGEYCPCPDRTKGEHIKPGNEVKQHYEGPIAPAERESRERVTTRPYTRPAIRPNTVHPPKTEESERKRPNGLSRYPNEESPESAPSKEDVEEEDEVAEVRKEVRPKKNIAMS